MNNNYTYSPYKVDLQASISEPGGCCSTCVHPFWQPWAHPQTSTALSCYSSVICQPKVWPSIISTQRRRVNLNFFITAMMVYIWSQHLEVGQLFKVHASRK